MKRLRYLLLLPLVAMLFSCNGDNSLPSVQIGIDLPEFEVELNLAEFLAAGEGNLTQAQGARAASAGYVYNFSINLENALLKKGTAVKFLKGLFVKNMAIQHKNQEEGGADLSDLSYLKLRINDAANPQLLAQVDFGQGEAKTLVGERRVELEVDRNNADLKPFLKGSELPLSVEVGALTPQMASMVASLYITLTAQVGN